MANPTFDDNVETMLAIHDIATDALGTPQSDEGLAEAVNEFRENFPDFTTEQQVSVTAYITGVFAGLFESGAPLHFLAIADGIARMGLEIAKDAEAAKAVVKSLDHNEVKAA